MQTAKIGVFPIKFSRRSPYWPVKMITFNMPFVEDGGQFLGAFVDVKKHVPMAMLFVF